MPPPRESLRELPASVGLLRLGVRRELERSLQRPAPRRALPTRGWSERWAAIRLRGIRRTGRDHVPSKQRRLCPRRPPSPPQATARLQTVASARYALAVTDT